MTSEEEQPDSGITRCLDCGGVLPMGVAGDCPACDSSRRGHAASAGVAEATAAAIEPDRIEIGLLTVLAPAWRYALSPHLEALADIADGRRASPPPVSTADRELDIGDRESGHSAATIVIAWALLESIAVGDAWRHGTATAAVRDPCAYLVALPELVLLEAAIEEAYTLRNILAHDHIWEVNFAETFAPDGSGSHRTILEATHQAGKVKGDRWARVVDMASRTTRLHGLSVVPTAIDCAAAAQVLVTIAEAVDAVRLARPGPAGQMRMRYRDLKWAPLDEVARRFAKDVG